MAFKDRIKDFRRVAAADLYANARNWRTHTERQASVLRSVLERLGYASALVVREAEDGALVLLDGHLRAGLDPEQMVPVLVTDLTEQEGEEYLLSADPIAAMAEADQSALKDLLDRVTARDDGGLSGLLNQVRVDYLDLTIGVLPETNDATETWAGMPGYENADLEAHRSVIVHFKTPEDVEAFAKALGVTVSAKAKFIWYPPVARDRAADKLVVSDGVAP